MEWVQTTGKTVEEALEVALDRLGVHAEDIEHEVIQEPKSGFLGRFGGTEARIRVRLKPISREKPQDKKRGRNRNGPGGGNGRGRGRRNEGRSGGRASEGDSDGGSSREGSAGRGGGGSNQSASGAGRSESGRSESGRSETGRGGEDGRSENPSEARQPSKDRSRQNPTRDKPQNRPQSRQNEGASAMDESNVSVEDQADAAEDFVLGLVSAMGLEGTVSSTIDDETIEVEVEGPELGLLVGPKAATLSAIEELTRAVVQREAGGHAARVRVDVGGYRAKRRAALAAFTRTVVDEVLSTGEERAMEPMGSIDRKTVHDAVSDVDGVATSSEGEDPRRYVVIRPT